MNRQDPQPKPQVSPDGFKYWDGSDWKQMPGKVCEWDGFEWQMKPSAIESEWNGTEWVAKPSGVKAQWSGTQWVAKPKGVESMWIGTAWVVKPTDVEAHWDGKQWVAKPIGVEANWDGSAWAIKPEGRVFWDVRSNRWRPDRRLRYSVVAVVALLVVGLAIGGLVWKSNASGSSDTAEPSNAGPAPMTVTGASTYYADSVCPIFATMHAADATPKGSPGRAEALANVALAYSNAEQRLSAPPAPWPAEVQEQVSQVQRDVQRNSEIYANPNDDGLSLAGPGGTSEAELTRMVLSSLEIYALGPLPCR